MYFSPNSSFNDWSLCSLSRFNSSSGLLWSDRLPWATSSKHLLTSLRSYLIFRLSNRFKAKMKPSVAEIIDIISLPFDVDEFPHLVPMGVIYFRSYSMIRSQIGRGGTTTSYRHQKQDRS